MSNHFSGWSQAMVDKYNQQIEAGRLKGKVVGVPIFTKPGDPERSFPPIPVKFKAAPRITTDEHDLNKTEASFLAWLRAQQPDWIGIQNMTFKLGHDCRYTPDFTSIAAGIITAWDVKAAWKDKRSGQSKVHVEDDARAKIQIAARLFTWVNFVIVWREGRGLDWKTQEIKP